MADDPIQALKAGLIAVLETPFADGTNHPGALAGEILAAWPEPEIRLEYPAIAISAGSEGTWEGYYPREFSITQPDDDDDPTLTQAVYDVGRIEIPLQVDVFADSVATRDEMVAAIRKSLRASVPNGSRARVLIPSYFNAAAEYTMGGTGMTPDRDMMSREWRGIFSVNGFIPDLIEGADQARFIEIQVAYDICISQPVFAPPIETKTIFSPA